MCFWNIYTKGLKLDESKKDKFNSGFMLKWKYVAFGLFVFRNSGQDSGAYGENSGNGQDVPICAKECEYGGSNHGKALLYC